MTGHAGHPGGPQSGPLSPSQSGRRRPAKPGRIAFVGSGPGDPGLLTTRARAVLANAALVFTDPDVSPAVLKLVGADLPPTAGPARQAQPADGSGTDVVVGGPDIRPALGEPAEVARILAAEAKNGVDVVLGVQEADPVKAAVAHFNNTLAIGQNNCEHGDSPCGHH